MFCKGEVNIQLCQEILSKLISQWVGHIILARQDGKSVYSGLQDATQGSHDENSTKQDEVDGTLLGYPAYFLGGIVRRQPVASYYLPSLWKAASYHLPGLSLVSSASHQHLQGLTEFQRQAAVPALEAGRTLHRGMNCHLYCISFGSSLLPAL